MVRSEKTRQLIIEKTAAIFNKKGYTGTYLSDLTAATGLTKGSIYGNFKNKNEVAVEAFRYNYAFQTKQLLAVLAQENTSIDQLIAFYNFYKEAYLPIFRNGGCAILNTAVDADDGNELLQKEVIQKINNWADRIISIIENGISKGELQCMDASAYAHRTIAMIEGSILISKTLNKPQILLDNLDYLIKEIETYKLK